ncbi:MAG: glycosyltransferase family 39 protein [Solirubrobacteraceae bacterium]
MGATAGERIAPSAGSVAGARPARADVARHAALAVAALTAAGLALRLSALGESLWGDELFTYAVSVPGLGGIGERIRQFELNPPLFFVFAALAAKLGDPAITLRLPSIALGTASIPLVYLLGLRTVGRGPALLGTAMFALSPFDVFYGTEARAYASVVFFALVAALALLAALRDGRAGWWLAFVAASAAALYTHYTAAFALAALLVWALWAHRERWRAILASAAAIALLFAPWIPSFMDQSDKFALVDRLTPIFVLRSQARALFGHPFVSLDAVPGVAGQVLIAALAAAGACVVVVRAMRLRREGRPLRPSEGVVLLALVAVATPLGMIAYAKLGGSNLVSPRNLAVSAPACLLLFAAAIMTLPRRWALAGSLLVAAVLAAGAVRTVVAPFQRPQTRAAAHWVDAHATAGAPVLESPYFLQFATVFPKLGPFLLRSDTPLRREISLSFRRPHPSYLPVGFAPTRAGLLPLFPRSAWARGRAAGALWAIAEVRSTFADVQTTRLLLPRPPAGSGRWRLASKRRLRGLIPVVILRYEPA